MNSAPKFGLAAVAALTTLVAASSALAQEAEGQAGVALPGQGPAAATAGDSDHDQMAGRLAVGFLGRNTVPIAAAGGGVNDIAAPVIGVRYWLDPALGIDVGLGFSNSGGSTEVKTGAQTTTTDLPSVTAFLIHGGVPLSLASAKHFSFQVVPELNVGFASSTDKATPARQYDIDYSGFMLDVGARAGAEIHFGFIGVPQLSLQGSVGLLFRTQNTKETDKIPAGEASTSISGTSISTTVGDNPWNIFTSNVAALYYF